MKVVFVIWLLSPYTQGSSVLYRKFIHPALARRESEIDDMISKVDRGSGCRAGASLGVCGCRAEASLGVCGVDTGSRSNDNARD